MKIEPIDFRYDEGFRGRRDKDVSPTINAMGGGGLSRHRMVAFTDNGGGQHPVTDDNTVIRRLTPRECWRLMAFDDEDFDKASAVCSDTQLYKQAGNSIVVTVLEAIFKQMLKEE